MTLETFSTRLNIRISVVSLRWVSCRREANRSSYFFLYLSIEVHSYGLNGLGEEALQLFYQIPKEMLDDRVYTCALNSCSHSGLIDQAWKIFSNVPIEQRTERIYTAMVRNSVSLSIGKSFSFWSIDLFRSMG